MSEERIFLQCLLWNLPLPARLCVPRDFSAWPCRKERSSCDAKEFPSRFQQCDPAATSLSLLQSTATGFFHLFISQSHSMDGFAQKWVSSAGSLKWGGCSCASPSKGWNQTQRTALGITSSEGNLSLLPLPSSPSSSVISKQQWAVRRNLGMRAPRACNAKWN